MGTRVSQAYKVGEVVDFKLTATDWDKLKAFGLGATIRLPKKGLVLVPVKLLQKPSVRLKIVDVFTV